MLCTYFCDIVCIWVNIDKAVQILPKPNNLADLTLQKVVYTMFSVNKYYYIGSIPRVMTVSTVIQNIHYHF